MQDFERGRYFTVISFWTEDLLFQIQISSVGRPLKIPCTNRMVRSINNDNAAARRGKTRRETISSKLLLIYPTVLCLLG